MYITKTKLIAAAVAAACGLPLAAQAQTNITVYGKLYPQINNYSISGASGARPLNTLVTGTASADVSGTVMESGNSRLGFRGTEGLGNGMKAFFQLEMALGVDDGTGKDISKGVLFGRDTFVGLAGGFGSVKFGNMDSVYKNLGDTLSFLGVSSGNFFSVSNILSKQGFGTSNAHRFHERFSNSIVYESPEFNGFQGLFGYSLGEVPGSTRSGSAISTGVKYEAGPVYLAIAHERHNDFFGGSRNVSNALSNTTGGTGKAKDGTALPGTSSTDTATRLTGQYKITKNTRVEANFAMIKLSEDGGARGKFQDYKHNAWSLAADHKMGAVTLAASYGQASAGSCSLVGGAVCTTDGLDGRMVNLGASYALSKRTQLYAVFSNLSNGNAASYSNVGDAPKPVSGQSVRQVALGVSHSF